MTSKEKIYIELIERIEALIENENDIISKMSTIACEIYQTFEQWNWVGFYRLVDKNTLKVGPYQGTHGCLVIDINQGVCGKCAKEKKVQIENDVASLPHHIACSADTKSEIVLPVFDKKNRLHAVLDIDSLVVNDFDKVDEKYLAAISDRVFNN